MEAKKIIISGDVQGVSYRYFARTEANKLGLLGWAKNEYDGTVTVFIQGTSDNISAFLDWAKDGSPMASVESIKTEVVEVDENLTKFEVK